MLVEEIVESYKQVWARSATGVKRKYRCTSGQKKGRVVAKPATCSTSVKQNKSIAAKKTRRIIGKKQAITRSRTIKRPTSNRVGRLNKKRITPRKRNKK
jgi:hypothetical protein|tara:strand:- start:422 stop:718 length:297 start_codon:yes stop_codon:yes gene_type:complete